MLSVNLNDCCVNVSSIVSFISEAAPPRLHYTMSSSCPGWADTGAGAGLSPQSATGLVTTRSFEPSRSKN